jgi:hypothetical protein
MEKETINLNKYRVKLSDNIKKSKILYSISTLPPEKWIKANHYDSKYRDELFEAIYKREEKIEIKRITIVENENHFDSFFQETINSFSNSLINRFYKYYYETSKKNQKKEDLNKYIKGALIEIRNEIFKDVYAVFASLHSSVDNSIILYKDSNIIDDIGYLIACLGEPEEEDKLTKYNEILIYDHCVLRVMHKNPFDPKDIDEIYYEESDDTDLYKDAFNDLFAIIETKQYGYSLTKFIERNVGKDFWRLYKDWEMLNVSIRDYVKNCFINYCPELKEIIIIKEEIIKLIDEKLISIQSPKIFQDIDDTEKIKLKIHDINVLENLQNIKNSINNLKSNKLNQFFKNLINQSK